MLRGRPENEGAPEFVIANSPPRMGSKEFPGVEQAYEAGERPPGILFYRSKEGFWLPYHLLQCMEFQADTLKLVFATEDVVIEGQGLHRLYVDLALQTVARVIEQGERYAAVAEPGLLISRIERIPRSKND